MTRFAFTITGSVHVEDPQVLRAVGGPAFTVDGHDVRDADDAADVIEVLLRTTVRLGVSEALGRQRALGALHVNVVEVPEVDPA